MMSPVNQGILEKLLDGSVTAGNLGFITILLQSWMVFGCKPLKIVLGVKSKKNESQVNATIILKEENNLGTNISQIDMLPTDAVILSVLIAVPIVTAPEFQELIGTIQNPQDSEEDIIAKIQSDIRAAEKISFPNSN